MKAEARMFASTVAISVPFWLYWARIAIRHEREAKAHRKMAEMHRGDPGMDLVAETEASMVAITASAHAIDALYGKLVDGIKMPSEIVERWAKSRPSRKNKLLQALAVHVDIDPQQWQREFDWLFDIARDKAVHHGERPNETVRHPLGMSVAPEMVTYSMESATRAVNLILDVFDKSSTTNSWIGELHRLRARTSQE